MIWACSDVFSLNTASTYLLAVGVMGSRIDAFALSRIDRYKPVTVCSYCTEWICMCNIKTSRTPPTPQMMAFSTLLSELFNELASLLSNMFEPRNFTFIRWQANVCSVLTVCTKDTGTAFRFHVMCSIIVDAPTQLVMAIVLKMM